MPNSKYNLQKQQDIMRARQLKNEIRYGDRPSEPFSRAGTRIPQEQSAMPEGDPLSEMLPRPEIVDKLKWYARWLSSESRLRAAATRIRNSNPSPDSVAPTKLPTDPAAIVKAFLLDSRRSECDRSGRTRFQQLLNKLFQMATADKMSPQVIGAINALLDRGFGKVAPSPAEIEAEARKGGFQIVHIHPVRGNIPVESADAKPALAPAPEFIEAEFRSTQ